ncbi:MAG: GNAT family N-acetyltransferase [Pseudomonadota bacterium]
MYSATHVDDYFLMNLQLISDRLIFTPLELADVDLVVDLWTDPEVVRYIEEVSTEAELQREMPDVIKRGGNGAIGEWCIADRQTGEKLGSTYVFPMPTEKDDIDYDLLDMKQMPDVDIEIGYFLKRSAWGQGYATEICKRMLQFAFQEVLLSEVVASVDAGNVASKNVLEKSGFLYAGRTLCWGKDSPIYKITRDEWIELRQSL